jgi:hypothetical protein
MEDTQAVEAPEHVEEQQEKTTLNFGQDQEVAKDTQAESTGQVENNVLNWEEDKRFKEHWSEDPNKMYESLKYHEKKQGEFDSQINDYKTQVGELGKYKSDYESLEKLFDHPELGPELLTTINKYKDPQNQAQSVQDDSPYAGEINELKQWKSQIEEQALGQYKQQQEAEQFTQIDAFAKQYNIEYNKDDFLNAMQTAQVDPASWSHYFKSQAADVALKNASNRAAEAALKKKSVVSSFPSQDSKASVASGNYQNYTEALNKVLGL